MDNDGKTVIQSGKLLDGRYIVGIVVKRTRKFVDLLDACEYRYVPRVGNSTELMCVMATAIPESVALEARNIIRVRQNHVTYWLPYISRNVLDDWAKVTSRVKAKAGRKGKS